MSYEKLWNMHLMIVALKYTKLSPPQISIIVRQFGISVALELPKKLEEVTMKSLRATLNDYESLCSMLLSNVLRPPFYTGRLKSIVLETYKCERHTAHLI